MRHKVRSPNVCCLETQCDETLHAAVVAAAKRADVSLAKFIRRAVEFYIRKGAPIR